MNPELKIIDGDGHIFEDAEGIGRHFPYTAAGGPPEGRCASYSKPYPVLTDPQTAGLVWHGCRRPISYCCVGAK